MTIVWKLVYRSLCCHDLLLSSGSVWSRPFKGAWRWQCSKINATLLPFHDEAGVHQSSVLNKLLWQRLFPKCAIKDFDQSTVYDVEKLSSATERCVGVTPEYAVVFAEKLELVRTDNITFCHKSHYINLLTTTCVNHALLSSNYLMKLSVNFTRYSINRFRH